MKIESLKILYKLCLIITGVSALNLSMNTYYTKLLLKRELRIFSLFSTSKTTETDLENQIPMPKNIDDLEMNLAILGNKAYWIQNNSIYSADVDDQGNFISSKAEQVDVFSLTKKELKTILKIVDSLNG